MLPEARRAHLSENVAWANKWQHHCLGATEPVNTNRTSAHIELNQKVSRAMVTLDNLQVNRGVRIGASPRGMYDNKKNIFYKLYRFECQLQK